MSITKDTKFNVLVTGGAGFIGSNIVEHLLNRNDIGKVRVLDNLSTGSIFNIELFFGHPKFEFFGGDIRNFDICKKACNDIHIISHQAALGSVPRSMKTPTVSHDSNVNGFLNLLEAARLAGIKRFVYASSSSVYGLTKNIHNLDHCKPISFYGMTKHINDLYASFYTKYFNMECIGLRYHNVFGKRQAFKGEYCAVIPIFIRQAILNKTISIHGDGQQYRDFTHIDNVVHVNILSIFTNNKDAFGKSIDIGSNSKISVNTLATIITNLTNSTSQIIHISARLGDIKASFAHMEQSKLILDYSPLTNFHDGIQKTIQFYSNQLTSH